jgi:hypothetical protein
MRRVALLLTESDGDPDATLRNETFRAALAHLGWTEGRNIQIDTRWNVAAADHVDMCTRDNSAHHDTI